MANSVIITVLHICVCLCVCACVFYGLAAKFSPSPLQPHGL